MMSHWYDIETGSPRYTVIGANGKERDTTLRDAKKLKLVPSVTTILQIPAKPALNVWLQNQVLEAALEYSPPRRIHGQFEYEGWEQEVKKWKAIVLDKSQKIGKDSAKKGASIHDSLEKLLLKELDLQQDFNSAFTAPVLDILDKEFGVLSWRPEISFSHEMGFGGKVDLHLPAKLDRNTGIVLDFKTKTGSADFEKDLGYDEHCMQLAAYREGLGLPDAVCYNLFISTETPGLLQLKKWTEEEVQRGWKMFRCLLEYWKLVNDYDPSTR